MKEQITKRKYPQLLLQYFTALGTDTFEVFNWAVQYVVAGNNSRLFVQIYSPDRIQMGKTEKMDGADLPGGSPIRHAL